MPVASLLFFVGTIYALRKWDAGKNAVRQDDTEAKMSSLTEQLDESRASLADATALLKVVEKQRDFAIGAKNEQFTVIEDACKERDTWQNLYRQSSLTNQHAQDWLMRELERVLVVANRYALDLKQPPVRVDQALADLVEEFAIQHGDKRPLDPAPPKREDGA